MKVLLMTEHFAPDFAGGGEVMSLQTARLAQQRGIHVEVLCTGDPRIHEYEGIRTHRLPIHRYRMNLAGRVAGDLARHADLIHAMSFHAYLPALRAARQSNIPIVCSLMALFADAWRQMKPLGLGRVWEQMERYLVRQPYDRIHFLTEASRDLGLKLSVNAARSVVIPLGVDAEDYTPIWPKEQKVLFAGKFGARKGVYDVIEAARRLPHVSFELVGFGDEDLKVRKLAPSNVAVLPLERGAALQLHFRRAAIFCMPSHAETFGLAVLEAMAAGCAVVSSAPLEFQGRRVRAGDLQGLTAALGELSSDPLMSEDLGRANVCIARDLTWARYGDAITSLYEEVLGGDATSNTSS